MTELIRIERVEPRTDHWVRLTFSDGAIKDVDLSAILERGGVFAAIRHDRALFELISVNRETGTVEWPGGIDLDAQVLYGHFEPEGLVLTRRMVREPTATAA